MNDLELTHHGVKGQKWGVRHDKEEDIKKSNETLDDYNKNRLKQVKVKNSNTKKISSSLGLVAGGVAGLLLSRAMAKNMSFAPVDNPKSKTGKMYVDKYSGISLNKFRSQSALRMVGLGLVGAAIGGAIAKGINKSRTAKTKTQLAEEEYNKTK